MVLAGKLPFPEYSIQKALSHTNLFQALSFTSTAKIPILLTLPPPQFPLTLGLAIAFFSGYRSIWLLLVISVIRSLGAGIQTPAVNAMFPQIVPAEKLTHVNGINQALNSLLLLLSPAVGGMVLGYFDIAWAFLLDVMTAAVAIIILFFLKTKRVVRASGNVSPFTDLREGLTFTFSHRLLKRLIICYGISFFLITPSAFLTPVMIERSFGGDVWRLTVNEMVWTVGSLLGGVFVSLHGEFKDKIRTIGTALIGFGLCFALLGVAKPFSLYLFFMGAAGFFSPVIATAQTVLIQENVTAAMMGRVFSIMQIISAGAMPVAMLLFGPLADVVAVETILLATGVLLAGLGVVFPRYN
ncbi:MAG: MFS transporter [bacterium]